MKSESFESSQLYEVGKIRSISQTSVQRAEEEKWLALGH